MVAMDREKNDGARVDHPGDADEGDRKRRVSLCRRARDILDAARTLGDGGGPLVFANGDGEPLDEKVLRQLLERQRVPTVPHGFRSSFRDWAAEETEHRRAVIEAALAHVVQNKVEAAYARSNLFERRRTLMDDCAAYRARTTRHPFSRRRTSGGRGAAT